MAGRALSLSLVVALFAIACAAQTATPRDAASAAASAVARDASSASAAAPQAMVNVADALKAATSPSAASARAEETGTTATTATTDPVVCELAAQADFLVENWSACGGVSSEEEPWCSEAMDAASEACYTPSAARGADSAPATAPPSDDPSVLEALASLESRLPDAVQPPSAADASGRGFSLYGCLAKFKCSLKCYLGLKPLKTSLIQEFGWWGFKAPYGVALSDCKFCCLAREEDGDLCYLDEQCDLTCDTSVGAGEDRCLCANPPGRCDAPDDCSPHCEPLEDCNFVTDACACVCNECDGNCADTEFCNEVCACEEIDPPCTPGSDACADCDGGSICVSDGGGGCQCICDQDETPCSGCDAGQFCPTGPVTNPAVECVCADPPECVPAECPHINNREPCCTADGRCGVEDASSECLITCIDESGDVTGICVKNCGQGNCPQEPPDGYACNCQDSCSVLEGPGQPPSCLNPFTKPCNKECNNAGGNQCTASGYKCCNCNNF